VQEQAAPNAPVAEKHATTIVHCSDLHFGHGFIPARAEQLLDRIREIGPDAVVVSGDLTMRAREAQFQDARRLLEQIKVPLLIIPGNHDVPLYNIFKRALLPFENYRKFMEPLSTNPLVLPRVCFWGMNTVNPLMHQQGKIRRVELERVCAWVRQQPPDAWRIVVMHQHVANVPGMHRPGVIPHAGEALARLSAAGAHAVLHGHTHYNRVTTTKEFFPAVVPPLAVICVGTATSERTRGEDRANSYNVLQFTAEKFVVRQCNWDPANRHFAEIKQFAFERSMFDTPAASHAK
jgi:3',5'-cyclic AMP phosphodiesterase CpdA